jgi:hypothetical protein
VEIARLTHLTLANYYESGHLHRIGGRSLGDHIAAMRRYWSAVADLLQRRKVCLRRRTAPSPASAEPSNRMVRGSGTGSNEIPR